MRERPNAGEKSNLPDGVEEVNGKLYDWTSGREYLGANPKAVKFALDNLKQSQEKVIPYDPDLDKYFTELMNEEKKQMPYDMAAWAFNKIWEKNIGRKAIVDENDKWIIRNFVKWLISDPDCLFSLDKGLLFCGVQGCGKSELMRTGVEFSDRFSNKYIMREIKFKRIGEMFIELNNGNNLGEVLRPYLTGHWCFDDIAQMNEDVVAYSRINIVETLINHRVGRKWVTLATTNLPPDQVEAKYGRTVASRFNQMFEAVEFETQTDYRTL